MPDLDVLAEANRQFTICNACRYCEGICTVFPAMELRTAFSNGDVAYLSTLCHDCGACLPACPFTPPHDYAVDIPSLMQLARTQTFEEYARPRSVWRALTRASSVGGLMVATAAFFAIVAVATGDPRRLVETHHGSGSFYAVVEYLWLVIPGFVASGLVIAAILAGAVAFARETRGGARRLLDARAIRRAAADALALVNLRGGGGECAYPGERKSSARRRLHHLVFYGFGLMFASTCSAAVEQELLGRQPPYGFLSVPVVLGTVGGVATTAGCLGFLALGVRAARNGRKRSESRRLDRLFTTTLLLSTVTGFLVLGLRSTPLLGPVLILHLGVLGGLYLTFPYSKFVHWVYRCVALVRSHVELDAETAPVVHEQPRPAVQPEPVAHGDG